jgi:hypothetical protein
MPDDNSKICLPKALEEELNAIKKRRAKWGQSGEAGVGVETDNGQAMSKEADVLKEALGMDLMGLALSGGGIRSHLQPLPAARTGPPAVFGLADGLAPLRRPRAQSGVSRDGEAPVPRIPTVYRA